MAERPGGQSESGRRRSRTTADALGADAPTADIRCGDVYLSCGVVGYKGQRQDGEGGKVGIALSFM